MFTPAMTDKEIRNEALQDYLELKTKFQIALEDFVRIQKKKAPESVLHSIVQTKTFRSRRHNSWDMRFFNRYHTLEGKLIYNFLIYTSFQRGEQTYYLFLRDINHFIVQMITPHFMQRYKERYLIPNEINMRGMSPVIYFLSTTFDMRRSDYTPETWSKEECEKRKVWISNQGLIVTEETKDMQILITFLDQENLTSRKSLVYEEENLVRFLKEGCRIAKLGKEEAAIGLTIQAAKLPDSKNIYMRYLERTTDPDRPDYDEYIQKQIKSWETLKEEVEKYKKNRKCLSDLYKSDTLLDLNLPEPPKCHKKWS